MPSATSASLNGFAAGCPSGSSRVRCRPGPAGDTTVIHRYSPIGTSCFCTKPEDLGVEPQRLVLVVNEHAGQVDSHGDPLPARAPAFVEPPLDDRFERCGVDVVELVPALAPGLDQTRSLENVEVLRDRLPRRAEPVLGRQTRADLKERLPVPVGQLIEDRAAVGSAKALKTSPTPTIMQVSTCLSRSAGTRQGDAVGPTAMRSAERQYKSCRQHSCALRRELAVQLPRGSFDPIAGQRAVFIHRPDGSAGEVDVTLVRRCSKHAVVLAGDAPSRRNPTAVCVLKRFDDLKVQVRRLHRERLRSRL